MSNKKDVSAKRVDKNTLLRLFGYIRKNRFLFPAAAVCALLSVIAALAAPQLLGTAVDTMTGPEKVNFAKLFTAIGILAAVYLVSVGSTWLMTYFTNRLAYRTANRLRHDLYQKLNELPLGFFDRRAHGDTISRFINDVDAVSDGIMQSLTALLTGVVTVAGTVIVMYSINWIMGTVVLLSAPFAYLVARFITKRSQKYFQAQAQAVGQLNGYAEEIISGAHTVKAFGHEGQAIASFEKTNARLFTLGTQSQFYGAMTNPSTRIINNTAYSVIGIVGGILAIAGRVTVGNITSFLIYSSLFSKPFNEITGVLTQIQAAFASCQRIFEVLDECSEAPDEADALRPDTCRGDIRFADVSFSYTPDKPLIRRLNLEVKAGSRIAIVGRTGAGKTTLVNLLMRFYEADSGCIYLDGIPVTRIARDSLRRSFGMVLQDTFLFTDTIRSNIAYGKPGATEQEVIAAAKAAGIDGFIRRLPKGYDTIVGKSGTLSQGQRQLLAIARAMLVNPPMLILDEATSNIDTRTELRIQAAFEKLMQGRTSFIIAHRLSTIRSADRILVMEQGNIVEQGTHRELLERKGAYYKLYNSQFPQQEEAGK